MKRLVVLCTVVFVAALLVGVLASQLFSMQSLRAAVPQTAQAESTPQAPLVSFEGVVRQGSATVPSSWVVGAYSFQVVPGTEISANGVPIQPGVWARVEAEKPEGQPLQATVIELQQAPDGDIFDRIVAIDNDTGIWQVGDTDVVVSQATTVQGTPSVGALVNVNGRWSLDGLAAGTIVVDSSAESAMYLGTIVQQQAGQWLVDDVVIDLSDSPPIVGDPEIGAQVEVVGTETGPRHLKAQSIRVSSGTAQFQQRNGWLVSVNGDTFPYLWRVNLLDGSGLSPAYVAVFENTVVDETAGAAGYRSWLDIQADYSGNGYYRARRIVVLAHPPKQTVTGIVEAMPAAGTLGQWRVSGHRVEVTGDTALIGAPQMGSLVTVLGTPDYSNKLTAESIQALGQ